jgi:hypothetical protein
LFWPYKHYRAVSRKIKHYSNTQETLGSIDLQEMINFTELNNKRLLQGLIVEKWRWQVLFLPRRWQVYCLPATGVVPGEPAD